MAGIHGRNRYGNRIAEIALGASRSPGMLIRTRPISWASKMARTCSKLAIRSRSASSVDHDEGGRIADTPLFAVLSCDLPVSRPKLWNSFCQPVVSMKHLFRVLLVTSANGFQCLFPSIRNGRLARSMVRHLRLGPPKDLS